MKKIISILLMLSMVFSLVACSTEPASEVVDNDNSEVSGEVSEEASDNGDAVQNVSLDELSEHELEFIDILVNTGWQSYGYTEDRENWIDNYGILIDFKEDFTLTYTDEKGTNEGEWNYDRYEAEYEDYIVKLHINGEEFYCSAGLDNEVYIYIESRERDFAAEFSGVGLDRKTDSVDYALGSLVGTVWRCELIEYADGSSETHSDDYILFEFTDSNNGLIEHTYTNETHKVSIDSDVSLIKSNDNSFNEIEKEFELTGDYFTNLNNDSNVAQVKILDNKLSIITSEQTLIFDYKGAKGAELNNEISLILSTVSDFTIELTETNTSMSVDTSDLFYNLTLKTDGTAVFSHNNHEIIGYWDYSNILIGESDYVGGEIKLSSNLINYASNEEFYASIYDKANNELPHFNISSELGSDLIGEINGDKLYIYTSDNNFSFKLNENSSFWID